MPLLFNWLTGGFDNSNIADNQANGNEQQSAASNQNALQQQSAAMNSQQINDAQNLINHFTHQISYAGMNSGQGDFTSTGLPTRIFMQGSIFTQGSLYPKPVDLPKTIDECCNVLKTYIEGRKALKCLLKV